MSQTSLELSRLRNLADYVAREFKSQYEGYCLQKHGRAAVFRATSIESGRTNPRTGKTSASSVWSNIVRFCQEKQMDPFLLIDRYFRYCMESSLSTPPPRPTHLCTDKAWKIYQRLEEEDAKEIARSARSQGEQFVRECRFRMHSESLSEPQAILSTLIDVNLTLSALYRYCVAAKMGYAKIAEKFRLAATLQYVRSRLAYDRVWDSILPEDLKKNYHDWYIQAING